MSRLLRIFRWRIGTEALDVRVGHWFCFVAAPIVLILAVKKLASLPLTEGEVVIGLLASSALTLLIVILGLVLPLPLIQKSAALDSGEHAP